MRNEYQFVLVRRQNSRQWDGGSLAITVCRCILTPWWLHQMETFAALLAIHRWIPRTKASGALMFSLICALINGWVNNREAGDLRRHRSRNDVTVMTSRLRQNVPRFAVGISKLISLNLYCDWILSSICSKGSNWQQNSVWYKPLSELMMV